MYMTTTAELLNAIFFLPVMSRHSLHQIFRCAQRPPLMESLCFCRPWVASVKGAAWWRCRSYWPSGS